RRSARSDLEAPLDALGSEVAVGSPAPKIPRPDQALAQRVTREHIMAALETIPEDYRMAVILADLEGLAYKEIAEVMQCPIGTVMSRIYRGRRLLHTLLRDHAAELGLVAPEQAEEESPDGKTVDIRTYRNKRGIA